jgi:uncharacterized protein
MNFTTLMRTCLSALFALSLGGAAWAAPGTPEAPPEGGCHSGAYEMSDGDRLIISPADEPHLRYRTPDGRSGKLYALENGGYAGGLGWSVQGDAVRAVFGACGDGALEFTRQGEAPVQGRRIDLPTQPMRFQSGELSLYGELVLPLDRRPRAVVVLQYGSDPESAVYHNYLQHLLPLEGIGVLVFDKRGTGRSQGVYSAHFGELAQDMAAVTRAVRGLESLAGVPVGLLGESQGGWVAPLAAAEADADFIVVAFGLAVPIAEEDRLEVLQSLRQRGFNEQATAAKAERFHRAVMRVVDSGFEAGMEELETLWRRYHAEPWFEGLGGDLSGAFAAHPPEAWDQVAAILWFSVDIHYDPAPVLAGTDPPMLWILGGKDTVAPNASTLDLLRELQGRGRPIDVAVFPHAEHGIIATADNEPRYLGRHSPGYFGLLVSWIQTRRLVGPYGDAELYERNRQ